MDNKVPLINLKFLNSREASLVVKGSAEVKHPQSHSELSQVLLLAVGGRNKEPGRDEHSCADPDVNILNTSRSWLFHISITFWQSYLSYISSGKNYNLFFLEANKPRKGKLPRSSFCAIDDLKEC